MPEMVLWNGQSVPGERMNVMVTQEPWSEYLLADGTVLRNKAVLTAVWRLCDQSALDGSPVYIYNTQNVAAVSRPLPASDVTSSVSFAEAFRELELVQVQPPCGIRSHASDCDCLGLLGNGDPA